MNQGSTRFKTPPFTLTIQFAPGLGAVHLRPDGSIECDKPYEPSDAARVFWEALGKHNPLRPALERARRALQEIAEVNPTTAGGNIAAQALDDIADPVASPGVIDPLLLTLTERPT